VGLAPATEDGLDSSSSGSGEESANGIFFSIGDTPQEKKKEQPRGRNHSFVCPNRFKLHFLGIIVCSRLNSFEKGEKGLGGTQEEVMNRRKSRHRQ
jgi:hypothetical protein